MHYNTTLDLFDINPYTKLGQILSICSQDIGQISIKTHNSAANLPKMMHTKFNLYVVNIKAHTQFG